MAGATEKSYMHVEPSCPTSVAGDPGKTGAPTRAVTKKLSADPASASAVATVLLAYLEDRLGLHGPDYRRPPAANLDGWETYLYGFQLHGDDLPPGWEGPLTLRIHADRRGLSRARREFEVPQHLARLGYPVPRPLLKEEAYELFGGPFLIMEQVPGPVLVRAMVAQPWNVFFFPDQMAATHARLHELPTDGFPALQEPYLPRLLRELRTVLTEHHFEGLAPGLDWLEAHAPPQPAVTSILHLDFHPLNLIRRADGTLVVLDWTYADLGDPHADVATTLMFLEAFPLQPHNLWERLALPLGRPIQVRRYLRAYRRRRPLDEGRLSYYRAWSAFIHLVRYGSWLRDGPKACDCRADASEHTNPDLMESLCRYFHRWTGMDLRL
jgi:aminoglycoside phosphotransferase (APT) family kinase protein